MPTSGSSLAFLDCFDVLDRALLADRGLQLKFTNEGAARNFRGRLMRARQLNREENARTYEKGHPLYGRSEYDRFQIRMREGDEEGDWVLLIEPYDNGMQIEEL